MILKNCYIHDFADNSEKSADFYFSEKIVSYAPHLADQFNIPRENQFHISDLNTEIISRVNCGRQDEFIIDAEGLISIPGGIDAHVHFDTPGFSHREDFEHGSMSAAAGGITTIIDMPCTSIPPVTSRKNFQIKMEAVKNNSYVDFAFFGGINGNNFDKLEASMEEMASEGVKGFKTYFISGMESFPRLNKLQFMKTLRYAAHLNLPVLLHAEDYESIKKAEDKFKEEKDDYLRYYKIRSQHCEVIAVKDAVEIAKKINGNLHIVHVASSSAAEILNEAGNSFNITYETCPHYLFFTYKDFERKGSALKTAPVVKDVSDKEKLWKFISDGYCKFIASDHAPSTLGEKKTGSFNLDYGGIPGVQTFLPMVFSEAFRRKVPLKRIIEISSVNAAKRYGLFPSKGSLQTGSDADFTLIRKCDPWKFENSMLLSKGKFSPFSGEYFSMNVALTILRGKIIFSEMSGITGRKDFGQYI